MTESTPAPAEKAGESDKLFTAVVSLLMVGIIAMMAVLWYRERSARQSAETELVKIQSMLGKLARDGGLPGAGRGVGPGDVVGRRELEGMQGIRAIIITPQAGDRLGLRPGDVLLVAEPQPATAPAP